MKECVIHHRCRCLDRNFTFEEWSSYLQETGYKDDAVFTAGRFSYNVNDVCCNPNVPVHFERGRGYRVTIETAQSPNGRWDCGYDIAVHYTNSLCGAHFIDDQEEGFSTEREAIYDGLLYARQMTEKEMQETQRRGERNFDDDFEPGRKTAEKTTHTMTELRLFLAEIEKHISIYDPRQLSLFNNC